jgi:hypothetical protein
VIRFHRHPAEPEAPAAEAVRLRPPEWSPPPEPSPPPRREPEPGAPRELFVRHARKEGRLVAVLRAVDHGAACIVEAEVYPHGSTQLVRPGPYTFPDLHRASAFVTEAVAALMYLGCDIQAQ